MTVRGEKIVRLSSASINRLRIAVAGLLLVPAVGVFGCRTTPNPVTGRPEVILMSAADEREVGEKAAGQVEAEFGLVQNAELQAYVGDISRKLAVHSPRRAVKYEVKVVEMDEPNAFALPGGQIFVSRGLVLLTNSKGELANVIAHEIGHVAARHAAQRHAHVKTFGLATALGTIASGGGGAEEQDESLGGPAGTAAYGRNQEREADRIGMDLAVSTTIDPGGLAAFLRTLENWGRLQRGFTEPQSYFSSHPATRERIAEAASSAETRRHSAGFLHEEDKNRHLRKLEGMAVGRPASEGVFVKDRFLHADLGVSVRFPRGWDRKNQNSQVVAISPRRDALVLLQLVGDGEDAKAAALQNAEDEEFELRKGTSVQIAGRQVFRAEASVTTSFGPIEAEVTWLASGGRVYRIVGGVDKGSLDRYRGTFRSVVRSFRSILASERDEITDLRLALIPAREGETLRELSARTGNEWDLNSTGVVNSIQTSAKLTRGQLVKVAVRRPLAGGVSDGDPTTAAERD